jgi:hypothetical protein
MEDVSLPPLTIPNEFQTEETEVIKSAHTQDISWLSRQGQDALGDKRKATLVCYYHHHKISSSLLTVLSEPLFQS